MNQFHKNYQTVTSLVPGKLAEGFRTLFSGDYNVPTDDVKAVRNTDVSYVLQFLPTISSGQPDFQGHTLDRVVPTLEALENRVAVLAMTSTTPEIRALRTECDGKEVFAVFAKYDI